MNLFQGSALVQVRFTNAVHEMASTSHYEVYVLEGSRWAFMARYLGKEREDAMTDARQTEMRTGRPTKVIREIYYKDLNYSEEAVAYMSPNAKGHEAQPGTRGKLSHQPARGPQQSHQASHGRSASKGAKKSEKIAPVPLSDGTFFARLILVLLASLVVAAGLTTALGFFVNALKNLGVAIPAALNAQIGLYWYGTMFLLTSVALNKAYVPWRQFFHRVRVNATERKQTKAEKRQARAPQNIKLRPRRPNLMEQAAKEKEKLEVRMLRGDPDVTPDPYEENENSVDAAPTDSLDFGSEQETATPTTNTATADQQSPAAAESEESAAKPEETDGRSEPDAQGKPAAPDDSPPGDSTSDQDALATPLTEMNTERLFMIRFLGDTVMTLRGRQDQMDPKLRFGVNLYLAGAASILADRHGLTPDEEKTVLDEALRRIGNTEDMRESFFDDFDSNMSDKKNEDLIHAGETAMIRNLSDTSSPSNGLDAVLQKWNVPSGPALPPIENVFLLTYANVTTSVTASGDDYMDRHNRMVRLAIAEHDGEEVRHTGKGIFARFDASDDAICAAIAMQQECAQQSKSSAPPPPLRISLVASLSGEGDPELSGNVFSYADTLCRRLGDGQIASDELVKKTCTIPAVSFGRSIPTAHSGIAERGRATEIRWEPVPA